jgi:hypothetical protein
MAHKHDIKEFPCIVCGTPIKIMDLPSYDPEKLEQNMWDGGTVDPIYMPYGSRLDGRSYYIGLCDECVEKKEKEKSIKRREDYV